MVEAKKNVCPAMDTKMPVVQIDDEDAEVMLMVNTAVSKRLAEQAGKTLDGRIAKLNIREANINRRERIVGEKEAKLMASRSVVDVLLDICVVAFAVIGFVHSLIFLAGW